MAKAKINPEFAYKTRDGQEVTDVEKNGSVAYPFTAKVGSKDTYFFTEQGYFYGRNRHHGLDLIKQPAKKTKPAKEIEVIQDITKVVPQNIPHKHYDLIVAWAKNPKLVVQLKNYDNTWRNINSRTPSWDNDIEYRIKPEEPKFLTIIGSDGKARSYPEPCRVKPNNRTLYYIPTMDSERQFSQDFQWNSDVVDNKYFRKNFVHLSEEAAELHAKAMLGID